MKKFYFLSIIIILAGCTTIIPAITKKKSFNIIDKPVAKEANEYFWNNYHQGNYDSIDNIIAKLNIALLDDPQNLRTTAHLGFVHIWALAERQRLQNANPSITEHIFLSQKYFDEAYHMNPHDTRILGFLADLTLAEGNQLVNKRKETQGYFLGLKSIRQWQQFNRFSIGYIMSNLDTSDKNFQKGLEWQYETIDDCSCEKNTRKTDYKKAIDNIRKSTDPKIHRACWNTWIAPHNWEGFCLNWGDMLVKNGDVNEAIRIYSLAKESDNYQEWPYKNELELRIKNAQNNVSAFNKPIDEQNIKDQQVIMFNSKMACMGCHQMSKNEFQKMGYQELGKEYYFIK
jgi:tetratricopeptide (TPR) repeat protein